MKINKFIKPAALSLACLLAASANANSSHSKYNEPMADYNFATFKIGLVSPTSLGGNSGLETSDTTYTGGFAVGRRMHERYSVELEYMYRGESTASSNAAGANPENLNNQWSVKSNTIMANVTFDLLEGCNPISPYVKAGIGMSSNKADDYTSYVYDRRLNRDAKAVYAGKTTNEFAWQVGAGLNVKTTDMLSTQIQYMYVDRGKIETEANYSSNGVSIPSSARTGKLKDHVITLGITTKF